MSAQLYLCDGCFIPAVVGEKTISVWIVGGPLYDKTVPSWLRKSSPSKPFQLKLPARSRQNGIRPDIRFSWMEDFVWPDRLWSVNCQLIEVIYSKFNFRVKQFVFSFLCYVCECTGTCRHALAFPTSVGDRSVLIQSHQRRVQQDRVHVLCDHAMVRRLDPRLVLVDCGKRRGRRGNAIYTICLCAATRILQPCEDDRMKSRNPSVALMLWLCLWWMCWLFFKSLLQLAGWLMEVLEWQEMIFI